MSAQHVSVSILTICLRHPLICGVIILLNVHLKVLARSSTFPTTVNFAVMQSERLRLFSRLRMIVWSLSKWVACVLWCLTTRILKSLEGLRSPRSEGLLFLQVWLALLEFQDWESVACQSERPWNSVVFDTLSFFYSQLCWKLFSMWTQMKYARSYSKKRMWMHR